MRITHRLRYQGYEQTLEVMTELARRDQDDPTVRQWAFDAYQLGGGRSAHAGAHAAAAERLLADRCVYMPDPTEVELLHGPAQWLAQRKPFGDCDDFAMAHACMMLSMGHRSAWEKIQWAGSAYPWDHVCSNVEVIPGGLQVICDPTEMGNLAVLLQSAARREVSPRLDDPSWGELSWLKRAA